jgi:hypothetical protein
VAVVALAVTVLAAVVLKIYDTIVDKSQTAGAHLHGPRYYYYNNRNRSTLSLSIVDDYHHHSTQNMHMYTSHRVYIISYHTHYYY